MKRLDRILAVVLIALGCVHNFVAAPMSYPELTARALWFIAAGLSLWYAGFINLLRTRPPGQDDRFLGWVCVLTNVSMLLFVLAYAAVVSSWANPQAIAFIAAVAVLTATSVLQLAQLRKRAAGTHPTPTEP
jgi:hypothetical protein